MQLLARNRRGQERGSTQELQGKAWASLLPWGPTGQTCLILDQGLQDQKMSLTEFLALTGQQDAAAAAVPFPMCGHPHVPNKVLQAAASQAGCEMKGLAHVC